MCGLARLSFHAWYSEPPYTKSPVIIHCHRPVYSTNSVLFQNLVSSLPPPGGLPTLRPPLPPVIPAGHGTVFAPTLFCVFFTIAYSYIYIVPITRASLCPAHPLSHKLFKGRGMDSSAEPGALSYYLNYTKLPWEQRPSLNLDKVPGSLDYCRASLVLGTRPLLVTLNPGVSSFMVRCNGNNSLFFF